MVGEFEVTRRVEGATAVVAVVGAIDVASADELDRALAAALDDRPAAVTVDLRRVNHLDSTGVRVLVRALRRSRTSGVPLTVCLQHDARIRRVLELSGVSGAIPIVDHC